MASTPPILDYGAKVSFAGRTPRVIRSPARGLWSLRRDRLARRIVVRITLTFVAFIGLGFLSAALTTRRCERE